MDGVNQGPPDEHHPPSSGRSRPATPGSNKTIFTHFYNIILANEWMEKFGQCLIASGGLTAVINGFFCIFTFRISLIIMGLLYW